MAPTAHYVQLLCTLPLLSTSLRPFPCDIELPAGGGSALRPPYGHHVRAHAFVPSFVSARV